MIPRGSEDLLLRVLSKSLSKRKGKVALAVFAVVMSASIASGLMTISQGIQEKIGLEFRNFGSNIMVTPRSDTVDIGLPGITLGSITEQRYINESDLWKIKRIDNWSANVLGYAPSLFQVVSLDSATTGVDVVLVGTYFDHAEESIQQSDGSPWRTGIKKVAPYWHVDGAWVEEGDDSGALVGLSVSEKTGLNLGSQFQVSYIDPDTQAETDHTLVVSGIVSTGDREDDQVFVNLGVAQNLTGRPNKVHSVQVSALCADCPAEIIAQEIEYKIPYVQAKSVKQLVRAEQQIMMQLNQILLLITIAALVSSGLCVMMTMTTSVVERKKEIGIMMALGADNRRVAGLFIIEAALIGVIGGLVGFGLGCILAQYIAAQVFSTTVPIIWLVLPFTLGISMLVTILASALPVRRALSIEPAIVLRGE